jgi:hypothetical protein
MFLFTLQLWSTFFIMTDYFTTLSVSRNNNPEQEW